MPGRSKPHADRGSDARTPSTSDVAAAIAAEERNAANLYDTAPCGHLSTTLDGTIVRINTTLAEWTGYDRAELVGRRRFTDLLTVGAQLVQGAEHALAPAGAVAAAGSGQGLC